jgi:hypothetical protein
MVPTKKNIQEKIQAMIQSYDSILWAIQSHRMFIEKNSFGNTRWRFTIDSLGLTRPWDSRHALNTHCAKTYPKPNSTLIEKRKSLSAGMKMASRDSRAPLQGLIKRKSTKLVI